MELPLHVYLLPLLLYLLLLSAVGGGVVVASGGGNTFGRSSFPPGFVFGASSSAYQYEGGAREGGKGPSIWDNFTHQHPEMMTDRSNGDVASDFYHRYKEDVSAMKDLGMDSFRFSISWTRILPNGSLSGGINREGVLYYNLLIDEIISKGLKPFATLFHFDTPQGLEDQYGGFLSHHIVDDFRQYAEVCFREFGDRVKHWITVNEPWELSYEGYTTGRFAPGRCSPWTVPTCSHGDSGREPYIVAHHQILAHAEAVKLYREKYQMTQKGQLGITFYIRWMLPYSDSESDQDATERAFDFMFGWFMEPLTKGTYPYNMRVLVEDRLPKFTVEQSEMIKGSFDFIGLNYYTATYIASLPIWNIANPSFETDSCAKEIAEKNGIPIGPRAASVWLYVYPKGIRDILLYTKNKYNNPVIYITENGLDEAANETLSLSESLKDDARINFYQQHLKYVLMAIKEGVDVRGYFAWSLLDNFEWSDGYTVRFGIYYVDYKDHTKRYPKSSALWFRRFLEV